MQIESRKLGKQKTYDPTWSWIVPPRDFAGARNLQLRSDQSCWCFCWTASSPQQNASSGCNKTTNLPRGNHWSLQPAWNCYKFFLILTTTGINSPFTVDMFLKLNVPVIQRTMGISSPMRHFLTVDNERLLLVCNNVVQNPTFHDIQMTILQPRMHCDPVSFSHYHYIFSSSLWTQDS